ncbi:Xaa-Pro peptidase family protein [Candidatus Babeliales bacterium]|nr:Xaa-Pro peptidase family protein [Candidatus Babeliales bacterium]
MCDYSLFKNRREQVLDFLRRENPELKNSMMMLFADYENSRNVFRQESSFYYLTGITEPGAVLCSYLDGTEILYLPNYGGVREKWVSTAFKDNNEESLSKLFCVSQVKFLGQSCKSYIFPPVFAKEYYENLIFDLNAFFKNNFEYLLFSPFDNFYRNYFFQIQIFKNILDYLPYLQDVTRDLAPLIHYMRRFKDEYEIDSIYKAIQITSMAHQTVASVISPECFENEIQAIAESVFTQAGAMGPAFPTIVASGKNTTILHYMDRDKKLKSDELVVVDMGAQYQYYSSDLTRTYPVGGKFNKEQLEIYNIVLETQNYIESIVKPGMFLNNKNEQDLSLNHLAINFLKKMGYEKYFAHSIGHFLGLDVHDTVSNQYPLAVGDVFTIEPGLYIPERNLGIRIEDDYLMTQDGVICLSYQLPKNPSEIEKLMEM